MSGYDGWNCSSHFVTGRKRVETKADILRVATRRQMGLGQPALNPALHLRFLIWECGSSFTTDPPPGLPGRLHVFASLAVRMEPCDWLWSLQTTGAIHQPSSLTGDHCITDGAVTRWKHWGVCITNLTQESRQPSANFAGPSISFYCIKLLRGPGLLLWWPVINYSANKRRLCTCSLFKPTFCRFSWGL